MVMQRNQTGGRFMLDVAGHNVGFLKSFSGLNLEGVVQEHDLGPENVVKKNITTIKPTEAKCKMGIAMGKGMYEWIKLAFDKQYEHRSGAFTAADFDYKAKSTLTFHDALVTSVTVPKMDGSSKDPAYFDITFDAERIEWAKAGGESIKSKIGVKQKAWLCCNFRLEIDGFSKECMEDVASVESFTWKCSVVRDQTGVVQWAPISPAKVTVPEIKFAIGYRHHQEWADFAKTWFVEGKREDEHEKNGRLVFLGPDVKEELGWIDFIHLGLTKLEDAESTANAETIRRFNVTMYCEEMKFTLNKVDA
jgi:T4-like virus tail tube protein gp19